MLGQYTHPEWEAAIGQMMAGEIRRYRNFAPFVRQTGERKAQTCAKGILRQLGAAYSWTSTVSARCHPLIFHNDQF
jgi:hypothetical protein